jgi:hypothetical protein
MIPVRFDRRLIPRESRRCRSGSARSAILSGCSSPSSPRGLVVDAARRNAALRRGRRQESEFAKLKAETQRLHRVVARHHALYRTV